MHIKGWNNVLLHRLKIILYVHWEWSYLSNRTACRIVRYVFNEPFFLLLSIASVQIPYSDGILMLHVTTYSDETQRENIFYSFDFIRFNTIRFDSIRFLLSLNAHRKWTRKFLEFNNLIRRIHIECHVECEMCDTWSFNLHIKFAFLCLSECINSFRCVCG